MERGLSNKFEIRTVRVLIEKVKPAIPADNRKKSLPGEKGGQGWNDVKTQRIFSLGELLLDKKRRWSNRLELKQGRRGRR